MWLNYHHFMYFRTIAEEGSIVAASEKLGIGQPALSSQLKNFEEVIGHKLFRRENRKLKLTEAGNQALVYAQKINELGLEFIDAMRDSRFSSNTNIQIGAMDSIPKAVLTILVKYIRDNYSDCKVRLVEGTRSSLVRYLDTKEVDLVLMNHTSLPVNSEKIYSSKSIGSFPISVYGTANYKSLKKNFPKSMKNQNMILPTKESKLRHDVEFYFRQRGIDINVVAETQDTSMLKSLGHESVGMVSLSDISAESFTKSKIIKIGELEHLREEYSVIAPKSFVDNPIVEEILKNFSLV
ncbi:MAG: LysR family transcriptional regulator [Bdellovibrionales bacterium]